jgi:hypothetical protein
MARVGYFEGTDPLLLTTLAAEGIETVPLGNTRDNHGKYVNHLTKGEVNVVVGWLHKIMPAEEERTSLLPIMLENLLGVCKVHNIPVLLTVPANLHDKVKKLLGDVGPNIHIVAPEKLEATIRKYL